MCGICGFTGGAGAEVIGRMMRAIEHRGPDDRGIMRDRDLSMGMVRLSIIDLAGGRQPMTNEAGDVSLVFNGEIFNYEDLRLDLERAGHVFATKSDTETVVHAYEEYGLEFPHRLNGMFAIALWDHGRKRLLLVRDRFGVKPLYYSIRGQVLVFGSEIKAVLEHPLVDRQIDTTALSHYLSLRNVPAPFTIYSGIRSLLPGHMLVYQGGHARTDRWYRLQMAEGNGDTDEHMLVEKIDFILRDSVRMRMRADVDFGAYLSGGIDSSMVVAIMSEYANHRVKTFCLSYADKPAFKQDAHYARVVAEIHGTEHHEYVMSASDLQNEVQKVAHHLDQPFGGVIAPYWLSRYMSRHVTVALSGDGADDLFASYGHIRLESAIAALNRATLEGRKPGSLEFGFFDGRRKFVSDMAGLDPWVRRLAYAAFMEDEKKELLSSKGKMYLNGADTTVFLRDIYQRSPEGTGVVNKMLYLDISTLLPNEILFFNDMLSMAHSVEVRTPFLDYRMVELACTISDTLKIRDGMLKYILRKVAARYLPKEILERPKEGFVLPKNQWMRGEMLPMIRETLTEERLAAHGLFDGAYVNGLLNRFVDGDETLTFKLWTLVMFQIWYEDNKITI